MVEQKELATLFKIKKLDEDYESLIPFAVVEGIYNEENCTFMTPDGVVYPHIEETIYPNIGYANRTIIEIDISLEKNEFGSLDFEFERKLNMDNSKKYLRLGKEPNKIYIKSNFINGLQIMLDEESKQYKEQQLKNEKITKQNKLESSLSNGYIGIDKTPKEICDLVKKTIKGQDEAIKTIVTSLWTTINGRDQNKPLSKKQMILIGPTGVGKTAIFKKLQQILDIPVVIFSVPGLSQAGYTGRSTDEILKQVYFETEENLDLAEKAIVILDEYDKIAYNGIDKSGDVSTVGVQNELLKMVEGYQRVIELNDKQENFQIDTTNMIFIATGAFQELFDQKEEKSIGFETTNKKTIDNKKKNITGNDLVKYGLKKESIGRFPIIIELNNLTKEIFREIILESDESELLAHVEFLKSLGVEVTNLDEIIEILIDDAINKDIGARGLTATISKIFLEIIYEVANNPGKYKEVHLGKDIINNPNDYQFIENKIIKRTLKLNNKTDKRYR